MGTDIGYMTKKTPEERVFLSENLLNYRSTDFGLIYEARWTETYVCTRERTFNYIHGCRGDEGFWSLLVSRKKDRKKEMKKGTSTRVRESTKKLSGGRKGWGVVGYDPLYLGIPCPQQFFLSVGRMDTISSPWNQIRSYPILKPPLSSLNFVMVIIPFLDTLNSSCTNKHFPDSERCPLLHKINHHGSRIYTHLKVHSLYVTLHRLEDEGQYQTWKSLKIKKSPP